MISTQGINKLLGTIVLLSGLLPVHLAVANPQTLYAGQHIPVGEVWIEANAEQTIVTYHTDPGWCMTETHLYVGLEAPQSSAPGQFPYSHQNLGCVQKDTYVITPGTQCGFFVAAHAVVEHWAFPIGGSINQYKVRLNSQTPTYFDSYVNVFDEEWQFYPAWCVDKFHYITTNRTYTDCLVFSTLDPNAPVDKPENLDRVNYILNQDYGATMEELQDAIWYLIDNDIPKPEAGTLIDVIVKDAQANGAGFEPGFGQVIGTIIKCGDNIQITLIVMDFDDIFLGEETAWAKSDDNIFWRNKKGKTMGWGSYFEIPCSDN
ncbi:MAG: hypothetical protein SVR94_18975 [Pseudomonadota bacterium]|nr:hypothetical protein [Pseudomonadota bacterium]